VRRAGCDGRRPAGRMGSSEALARLSLQGSAAQRYCASALGAGKGRRHIKQQPSWITTLLSSVSSWLCRHDLQLRSNGQARISMTHEFLTDLEPGSNIGSLIGVGGGAGLKPHNPAFLAFYPGVTESHRRPANRRPDDGKQFVAGVGLWLIGADAVQHASASRSVFTLQTQIAVRAALPPRVDAVPA
jgi:hypothetical protein